MQIKQEIYDALIQTRDDAFAQADEAKGAYAALEDEYDSVRAELYEAKADAAASDMADDIVEVFSQAIFEYILSNDHMDELPMGGVWLRAKLCQDMAFVLRHTASEVDGVLDKWESDRKHQALVALRENLMAAVQAHGLTSDDQSTVDSDA